MTGIPHILTLNYILYWYRKRVKECGEFEIDGEYAFFIEIKNCPKTKITILIMYILYYIRFIAKITYYYIIENILRYNNITATWLYGPRFKILMLNKLIFLSRADVILLSTAV